MLREPSAVFLGSVARANAHFDVGEDRALARGDGPHPRQRRPEVAFDVHRQRLQRGHVEDSQPSGRLGRRCRCQSVQGPQEGRQGLAGSRRGDHQGVPARGDGVPRPDLGRSRLGEGALEPRRGEMSEAGQRALRHEFDTTGDP